VPYSPLLHFGVRLFLHPAPTRYTVSQMLCMRCGALQPAGDRCCNKSCPTRSEFPGPLFDTALKKSEPEEKDEGTLGSLSRYYCDICHLHDNAPDKDIYHCPYCNVCRLGKGLGVDFWHCMKCNACISMSVGEHKCITHSLEGNCPICSTSMFESRQQIKVGWAACLCVTLFCIWLH
jgi:hypothetical protein